MTTPDDITHMWNLKYDTNISTEQKQTHRHREQSCGCQGGGGGREMSWGLGISRCKLSKMDKQQGPTGNYE